MVRTLCVKERSESGFKASRTVILTSKTIRAFGGTSSAFNILKDNEDGGSNTAEVFMARMKPRVLILGQS
ncbi:hypothetical protein TNCV_1686601 [Trichonephila clavipes]|nr:hypothetical protein TNCV_1686601 [Trichonephila clavipes]